MPALQRAARDTPVLLHRLVLSSFPTSLLWSSSAELSSAAACEISAHALHCHIKKVDVHRASRRSQVGLTRHFDSEGAVRSHLCSSRRRAPAQRAWPDGPPQLRRADAGAKLAEVGSAGLSSSDARLVPGPRPSRSCAGLRDPPSRLEDLASGVPRDLKVPHPCAHSVRLCEPGSAGAGSDAHSCSPTPAPSSHAARSRSLSKVDSACPGSGPSPRLRVPFHYAEPARVGRGSVPTRVCTLNPPWGLQSPLGAIAPAIPLLLRGPLRRAERHWRSGLRVLPRRCPSPLGRSSACSVRALPRQAGASPPAPVPQTPTLSYAASTRLRCSS